MNTRMVLVALAFFVIATAAFAKEDANVGTWKLNEAKSKVPAGASKNSSVIYTAEGDNYKCVVEGVDGSGSPMHNEWTGKFDGKDYPVTGDAVTDSRAVQKVDARHYKLTGKKDGKVVQSGTISYSPDGKTRTVAVSSTDAQGKKVATTFVYDKQ